MFKSKSSIVFFFACPCFFFFLLNGGVLVLLCGRVDCVSLLSCVRLFPFGFQYPVFILTILSLTYAFLFLVFWAGDSFLLSFALSLAFRWLLVLLSFALSLDFRCLLVCLLLFWCSCLTARFFNLVNFLPRHPPILPFRRLSNVLSLYLLGT